MFKLLVAAIAITYSINSQANTNFDISGLQGTWGGVSCEGGSNPHPEIEIEANSLRNQFRAHIVDESNDLSLSQVDQGSEDSDFGGSRCYIYCGEGESKTKSKAKTTAPNTILIKYKRQQRELLSPFWSSNFEEAVQYELINANTMRRSYTNSERKTWWICYYKK